MVMIVNNFEIGDRIEIINNNCTGTLCHKSPIIDRAILKDPVYTSNGEPFNKDGYCIVGKEWGAELTAYVKNQRYSVNDAGDVTRKITGELIGCIFSVNRAYFFGSKYAEEVFSPAELSDLADLIILFKQRKEC